VPCLYPSNCPVFRLVVAAVLNHLKAPRPDGTCRIRRPHRMQHLYNIELTISATTLIAQNNPQICTQLSAEWRAITTAVCIWPTTQHRGVMANSTTSDPRGSRPYQMGQYVLTLPTLKIETWPPKTIQKHGRSRRIWRGSGRCRMELAIVGDMEIGTNAVQT